MAGLRAESAQATEEARVLYLSALRADPQAGAAWAGLVRTTCALPNEKVKDVIASALRAADRPALPLLAFAQCRLTSTEQSAAEDAERASRLALQFEPLLKQASGTLQAALTAQDKLTAAKRVRAAYELYAGESLGTGAQNTEDQNEPPMLSAIDRDVLRGEIPRARDTAVGRLTLGELSVRTMALGLTQAALEMAQQVLVNEADDPNAGLVVMLAQRPPELSGLTHLLLNQRTDVCSLGLVLLAVELKRTQADVADHLLDELSLEDAAKLDPLLGSWLREARR